MEQKTIWQHFLIIGISILLLTSVFISCERTDHVKTVNYIYKNRTGIDLDMEIYNFYHGLIKNFTIPNDSETETNTTKEEVPALFYFYNPFRTGDSIVVKFSDNKCLYLSKSISSKIFIIEEYDNYSNELMRESKYTLYFTFTEEDYNASVECDTAISYL